MRPLIILGTGGNALDILDIVEATNRVAPTWDIVGYLDDSKSVGSTFEGVAIVGGIRDAAARTDCLFVNAIGSDRSFRRRPTILGQTGLDAERFATLVHPHAAVSSRARFGPGTCVNAGVVVAGGVTVGVHVWLGSGCILGHDAVIEDYAIVAPRAVLSGAVRVGSAAYVGGGASVRQRVTIGERALVGLGAVVISEVAAGTTVVGNPARELARPPRQGKVGDSQIQPGLTDTPGPTGNT